MHPATPPVHRTILLMDVERFSDPQRTTVHHTSVRADLYDIVEQAFSDARIPWHRCYHEDRGDGIMILVRADIPKRLFAESLPLSLIKEVRRHNANRASAGQIRLRLALHAGEISFDAHGATGPALTFAFRLLDAAPLKQVLATSPGVLAMATSDWFFEEVVRQSPVCEPNRYRQISVAVKETITTAWVCLPDHPYAPTGTLLGDEVTAQPAGDLIQPPLGAAEPSPLVIMLDAQAHVLLLIACQDTSATPATVIAPPRRHSSGTMLADLADAELGRLVAARTRSSLVGAFRGCLCVIGRLRSPHMIEGHGSHKEGQLRSSSISLAVDAADRTRDRLAENSEDGDAAVPASDGDRRVARLPRLATVGLVGIAVAIAIWWLCEVC
jgi:hypothetical protein